MENNEVKPWHLLIFTGLICCMIYMIYYKPTTVYVKSENITNVDSLNSVIDSLQTEIFVLEDGFDFKEHRYEDIIFEYELGMSYLKDYHPKAYKDFHRIIGMRERFSSELERENKKRISIDKF